MEHVVFFPSPDGSAAFRRVPSLDEAVHLVEHLRNVEGVDHATCHALIDVPLAFRAYYRVEVDAAPAPYADEQPEAAQQIDPQPAEDGREPVSAGAQGGPNGHRVAGPNSLGFFA